MFNRVTGTLTSADIQDINNAMALVESKLSFSQGLTPEERKKGGWYLSPNALLLFKAQLVAAKHKPANFPKLDVAEFEKDVTLIEQLAFIENQLLKLLFIVKDTRRLLTKDVAEEGAYVYAMLKVLHDIGIEGGEQFKSLKARMPKTGKKHKPKITNP